MQHDASQQHQPDRPQSGAEALQKSGVMVELLGALIDLQVAQHVTEHKQAEHAACQGHHHLLAYDRLIEKGGLLETAVQSNRSHGSAPL
jgi:hypothetical protein